MFFCCFNDVIEKKGACNNFTIHLEWVQENGLMVGLDLTHKKI